MMRFWVWGGVAVAMTGLASWAGGQGVARAVQAALGAAPPGWQLAAGQVSAAGFPARVGARLEKVQMAAPEAGFAWQLPQVQASAPIWSPLRWQADLALPQQVMLAGLRFELTGQGAQASAGFGLGPHVPLQAAALQMTAPALHHEAAMAPSLSAQQIDIALTLLEGPQSYQLVARINRLALPPRLAATLAPAAHLPDEIDTLSLDAVLHVMQPFALLAEPSFGLSSLVLKDASLLWDGHRLSASGTLALDPNGDLAGTLTLALSDWPVWLDLALAAGWLPRERKPMMTAMAAYLAGQSDDGSLRLPLSFERGRMSLAAIPLGAAPRF